MRIIVIGAGIGGLAAALTLGRSGFEVENAQTSVGPRMPTV
jgi:2-polyprenyl-6-methoxyphenol hydroxylase-like FAD-dependent oxidoreductase